MSFIRKLSQPTWKVAEYMGKQTNQGLDMDVLNKIIRLSGVTADPHEVQADLKNQLQFVEVLQQVDTEGLEPLSRIVAPVTCPDPSEIAGEFANKTASAIDPPKWTPTDLAAKHKNNYYVVEKQLGA